VEEAMQRRNVLAPTGLYSYACLFGLLGCASLARPIPEPKPTKVYASFSKTWVAAVDYLARSGIALDTADRSSGVIKADLTATILDKSHFGSCEGSVIEFQGSEYASNQHGDWYWYTPQFHGPPIGRPFIAIIQGDSAHAKLSVRSEWIDAAGKEVKCAETSRWRDQQTEAAIKTQAERP
jgi:hypothetical protein